MDKIEKIRKRIEELLNKWKYGSSTEAKYRCEAYKELLEDIDSIQEEPVSEGMEEIASHLAQKYFPNDCNVWARPNIEAQDCKSACIEMAKWQKAKDQETIELAEDHAMFAGMEKMKEEMLKDAVEGEVGYWNIRGLSLNIRLPKEFEEGDKVKVVLIKED